jgi:hypothetical protein
LVDPGRLVFVADMTGTPADSTGANDGSSKPADSSNCPPGSNQPATTKQPLTSPSTPPSDGATTPPSEGTTTPPSEGTTTQLAPPSSGLQGLLPAQPLGSPPVPPSSDSNQPQEGSKDKEEPKKTDTDPAIDLIFGGDSQQASTPTKTGPKTEKLSDGTMVTTYPDGTKIALIPVTYKGSSTYTRVETDRFGASTTTQPDGTKILKYQGNTQITKPDGTQIDYYRDGDKSTFQPSALDQQVIETKGGETIIFQHGGWTKIYKDANGNTRTSTKEPDGTWITKFDNGDTTKRFDDGSSLTTKTDGTLITEDRNGKKITEKPDGTIISENTDGTWFITFPKKSDGTQKTYFSDGTCKDAAGNVIPC